MGSEQGQGASPLVSRRDDQVYLREDPPGAARGRGGRSIYDLNRDPVSKRGCKSVLSWANWTGDHPLN